jgi:hypothetical protein
MPQQVVPASRRQRDLQHRQPKLELGVVGRRQREELLPSAMPGDSDKNFTLPASSWNRITVTLVRVSPSLPALPSLTGVPGDRSVNLRASSTPLAVLVGFGLGDGHNLGDRLLEAALLGRP